MNCAACAKNDICLLKKDGREFRSGCSNGMQKACENCSKGERCPEAHQGGYCRLYMSKFARNIFFGKSDTPEQGGLVL